MSKTDGLPEILGSITGNKLKLPWKKAGGDKEGQRTDHNDENKQENGLIYKNIGPAKTKIHHDFSGSLQKLNCIRKVDFVGERSLTMQVLVPFKRNNFVLTSISCISLGHQLSNAITQESYILHSKKKHSFLS